MTILVWSMRASAKKLTIHFYSQPALIVAEQLLGKFLVRRAGKRLIASKIVETEAYVGFRDRASHASRGKTKRNALMFGPPGVAYVYLVYGMYCCLNIVTSRRGYPAAVLIRAVEPIHAKDIRAAAGPGKVCRYFKIDRGLNGVSMVGGLMWVEDRDERLAPGDIVRARRIGVDYAGLYKKKLWRYYLSSSPSVSRR